MKVAIVGYGNVGTATHHMVRPELPTAIFDPAKGLEEDVSSCEVVFLCLPTEAGQCGHDLEAFKDLPPLGDGTTACVRSTVSPGQIAQLKQTNPRQSWCYFPEFRTEGAMREGTPPTMPLFVGARTDEDLKRLGAVVRGELVDMPVEAMEIAKLFINAILATHVALANEVYELANSLGAEWEKIRAVLETDKRVGSHYRVTEERGFGGSCLPKDLLAFSRIADLHGVKFEILDAVRKSNDWVRSES